MSTDGYKPRNPFAKAPKQSNGDERPKKKVRTFNNPFENTDIYGHSEGSGFKTSDIVNGKYEDEITSDFNMPYFGQEPDQQDHVDHSDHKQGRTLFKKGPKKEPAFDYSRSGMQFKPEILNNPMADLALNTGKK
jgi:hypothetical protein